MQDPSKTNQKLFKENPSLQQSIQKLACRKNGGEFPIELPLSGIHREDGTHALGIIRDINMDNHYPVNNSHVQVKTK